MRGFSSVIVGNFNYPVKIVGFGASIIVGTASPVNIGISLTTISDLDISGIAVDCNNKAEVGLDIYRTPNDNNARPYADCSIDRVSIYNARKWSTLLSDSALYVTGEFRTLSVTNIVIDKSIADAGVLTLGNTGVYGITIQRIGNSGTDQKASNMVLLDNITVEDVYSADAYYTADQDAIRIFANYKTSDEKLNFDSALVSNVYCRNIRGRIAKCQMHSVSINNVMLVSDIDGAGYTGIIANKAVIENQVGTVNVSGMSVFVKEGGCVCAYLVRASAMVGS